jgi:hypothetical protein
MKYACLVYHDDATRPGARPDDELAAIVADCGAWLERLRKDGHHVFSAGLQCAGSAMTVRHHGGTLAVTDGPFAETKEHLGGLIVVEARDLNEALRLASTFPPGAGTIEVRPVMDPHADLPDPADRRLAAALRSRARTQPGVVGLVNGCAT